MRGKACEVKLLGAALLHVWPLHYDPASHVHGQIKLLLQYSVQLDETLHDNGDLFYLPPEMFGPLMETCERFLVLYMAVHQHFQSSDMLMFNVTPKLHLLWHAVYACQFLHARYSWCYSGDRENQTHVTKTA